MRSILEWENEEGVSNFLNDAKCPYELIEICWVSLHQFERAKRHPDSVSLDTTTKSNGQNRPAAHTNAMDGDFKSLLALLFLLRNETQKSFIFVATCLGRIYGLKFLKAMPMFLRDGDKQITQTVRQCASLRIFNPKA